MLNRIAQGAVRELAGLGIVDLTADEIVRLHILGEIQERAGRHSDFVLRGLPVSVGNVVLYPMSCAASDWFQRALVWFECKPLTMFWAVPFAMAHSRSGKEFDENDTAKKAGAAISDWVSKLTCTRAEIDEACGLVRDYALDVERAEARSAFLTFAKWAEQTDAGIPDDMIEACAAVFHNAEKKESEDESEPEYSRWRVTCAELAAMCGGSPRDWYAEDVRIVAHAYKTAVESMAARAGVGTGAKTIPQTVVTAIRNFRQAVSDIIESRKRRSTNG